MFFFLFDQNYKLLKSSEKFKFNQLIGAKLYNGKMNYIIVFLFIGLVHFGQTNSILSNEFFTNYFTDNDFGSWTITGSNIPADHFFTQCGTERIFGGNYLDK